MAKLYILLLILATSLFADAPATVCEVLSDPAHFQGKRVSIRGHARMGDEGSWLVTESDCTTRIVIKGFTWPLVIWLAGPNSSMRFSANNHVDSKGAKHLENQIRKLRVKKTDPRLVLTYVGIFESALDRDPLVGRDDKGKLFGFGFGHLSGSPAQLLVEEIRDPALSENTLQK